MNLVTNGSFENYINGWDWTYNAGVFMGYSNAPSGTSWAHVYGSLSQELVTTPGQEYHLRFAMAGNPNADGSIVANVYWGGSLLGSNFWQPSWQGFSNLGWVYVDYDVVATAPTTTLLFSNPFVGTQRIFFLDDVQVLSESEEPLTATVPDTCPAGLFTLLALGLVMAPKKPYARLMRSE